MLHSNLRSLESRIEAMRWRVRSYYDYRAFAVTAVERLCKVGLLGFGWDTSGRTSPLNVHYHEWKLSYHSKAEGFGFERKTRARGCCHCKVTSESGTDGRTNARNLVLSLQSLGAEALVDSQLFQD